MVGARLFCREIDSDYSTPPAYPFRLLYSCQPRVLGFRLPDRLLTTHYKAIYVRLHLSIYGLLILSDGLVLLPYPRRDSPLYELLAKPSVFVEAEVQ